MGRLLLWAPHTLIIMPPNNIIIGVLIVGVCPAGGARGWNWHFLVEWIRERNFCRQITESTGRTDVFWGVTFDRISMEAPGSS